MDTITITNTDLTAIVSAIDRNRPQSTAIDNQKRKMKPFNQPAAYCTSCGKVYCRSRDVPYEYQCVCCACYGLIKSWYSRPFACVLCYKNEAFYRTYAEELYE